MLQFKPKKLLSIKENIYDEETIKESFPSRTALQHSTDKRSQTKSSEDKGLSELLRKRPLSELDQSYLVSDSLKQRLQIPKTNQKQYIQVKIVTLEDPSYQNQTKFRLYKDCAVGIDLTEFEAEEDEELCVEAF